MTGDRQAEASELRSCPPSLRSPMTRNDVRWRGACWTYEHPVRSFAFWVGLHIALGVLSTVFVFSFLGASLSEPGAPLFAALVIGFFAVVGFANWASAAYGAVSALRRLHSN